MSSAAEMSGAQMGASVLWRRWGLVLAGALVLLQAALSLSLKPGYALTAFTDLNFVALILLATAAMVRSAVASRGQTRFFWMLMAGGCALWSISLWTFVQYEVIQGVPTPDLSFADVTLFLHLVPFITAVGLGAPQRAERNKLYLTYLGFVLLLLWWVYLYAFAVLPFQYLRWDKDAYNPRFDALYLIESLMLLALLGLVVLRTPPPWRRLYRHLFVASSLYTFSSQQANAAVYVEKYFSGGLYDILYALAIAWFFWVGVLGHEIGPEAEAGHPPPRSLSRSLAWPLAVLAVLSIPVLGIWELLQRDQPPWLSSYRLVLSFTAIVVVGAAVFLRQFLQDRELLRLLAQSQEDLEKLQRLQTELVQKEKLASLGQLVSGAAHEINNPLTAILGYSDLLDKNTRLDPEVHAMVRKIWQNARRTSDVVADLLSFAQRASSSDRAVEIGPLLKQAADAARAQLQNEKINIEMSIASPLPAVKGNASQLLQVWRHLLNNAIEAQREAEGGTIRVTANLEQSEVVVAFLDCGPGIRQPERVFDPFYSTKPVGQGTGLGLSVCFGIVQNHHGRITCRSRPEGGAVFEVRLPAIMTTVAVAGA